MSESTHISIVTEKTFETEVIARSKNTLVVVDFWANWCNPCKILMPMLVKLAQEYQGSFHLAKIDTEKEKGLAEFFNIRSIPSVKLFKLGDIVDEFNGVLPEEEIRQYINEHQFSDIDQQLLTARKAIEDNDLSHAKTILENLLIIDASNISAILLLTEIELELKNFQKVDELLDQVPLQFTDDTKVQELKIMNNFSKEIIDIGDLDELERQATESKDINLEFKLACYYALERNFETSLDIFLNIMKKNRKFKDDGARKNILAIFDILGGAGPIVNIYRVKMSRLLH